MRSSSASWHPVFCWVRVVMLLAACATATARASASQKRSSSIPDPGPVGGHVRAPPPRAAYRPDGSHAAGRARPPPAPPRHLNQALLPGYDEAPPVLPRRGALLCPGTIARGRLQAGTRRRRPRTALAQGSDSDGTIGP